MKLKTLTPILLPILLSVIAYLLYFVLYKLGYYFSGNAKRLFFIVLLIPSFCGSSLKFRARIFSFIILVEIVYFALNIFLSGTLVF